MRKNKAKKMAIAMISCCAVACLSIGAIAAGAENLSNVTIADTNSFYVVNGASVLLKTSAVGGVDDNAIRFVFEMSEEQYMSLLADPDAETKSFAEGVSVGALVVPTAKIGANETEGTVTTDDVVNCSATAAQEIPFEKWTYADSEVEGKAEKVYYACAYLYNLPPVAYDAEISSCAYITTSTGTVYTNVSTRTMSYVANAALDSGKYTGTDSETVLKGYIPTLSQRLYSIDDATLDLSDLKGTVTAIKDKDGNSIMSAVKDGVATISGDDVLNSANPTAATGAIETITVSTTVATYNIPLKVCTDVINSAKEFDDMGKFLMDNPSQSGCKVIRGYYVLGNDIDFSEEYKDGYISDFGLKQIGAQNSSFKNGWDATFDGQGHIITGLKLTKSGNYHNSLFGVVMAKDTNHGTNGGVIKNVAFVNCSFDNAGLYESAFLASQVYGTLENIYLDVTLATTTNNTVNFAFVGQKENSNGVCGSTINNVTVFVRNTLTAKEFVMGGTTDNFEKVKGDGDIVVIGGGSESQIHSQYATIKALENANGKVNAYTSIADASTKAELTSCGSTTFAMKDGVYTISWNGKAVYSENIVFELAEQLYSIDDATIDLSKVSGDITKIADKDGNEITYEALKDGVVKVSGDDVLNSANPTAATGAIETITVSTTVATYNIPLKVCTDVINSAGEFNEIAEKFMTTAPSNSNLKIVQGYYALGNNIDFSEKYASGYASPFSYKDVGGNSGGYTHGWDATFDGQGYQIQNLKLIKSAKGVWEVSLFGTIAGGDSSKGTVGGKVMNVAFVNCSMASDLKNSAFLANRVYGTIENVYLDVAMSALTSTGNSAFVGLTAGGGVESKDTKTSISNVTVLVRNTLGSADNIIRGSVDGLQSIDGTFVTIGGNNATRIHAQYSAETAIADLTAKNSNIHAYTSIANASTDTALTSCGSTTFAIKDGVYTISWNGNVVYTENLATA